MKSNCTLLFMQGRTSLQSTIAVFFYKRWKDLYKKSASTKTKTLFSGDQTHFSGGTKPHATDPHFILVAFQKCLNQIAKTIKLWRYPEYNNKCFELSKKYSVQIWNKMVIKQWSPQFPHLSRLAQAVRPFWSKRCPEAIKSRSSWNIKKLQWVIFYHYIRLPPYSVFKIVAFVKELLDRGFF